jgi:hypothetical protein
VRRERADPSAWIVYRSSPEENAIRAGAAAAGFALVASTEITATITKPSRIDPLPSVRG